MFRPVDLNEEFVLPTSEEEFEQVIGWVMEEYPAIKDKDLCAGVISIAIRHLPNDQATTTLKYLGNTVIKNIANQIAYLKSEKIKHETQVNGLYNRLVSDPGDTQARDQLETWAQDGSKTAKDALNKLSTESNKDTASEANVLPIKA